jgi:hypothetical protein
MDYVNRAGWSARPPKNPYTAVVTSAGIAVHNVGSKMRPPTTLGEAATAMRSVQAFHQDTQGWNDFAYGFGVGAGLIFEGRGWGWIDGADTGAGRLMHSVVWLSDSDVYEPSTEDLAAINTVIAEHARRYPAAATNVKGHGDINATGCPGRQLDAWLGAGRPGPTPPPAATTAPGSTRRDRTMQPFTNVLGLGELLDINPTTGELRNWWAQPDVADLAGPGRPVEGEFESLGPALPIVDKAGKMTQVWFQAIASGFGSPPVTVIQALDAGRAVWSSAGTNELRRFLAAH